LEEIPKAIANYHVCVVKMMKLDSNIISRAVQMKLIMQYGVGLEGTVIIVSRALLMDFRKFHFFV